MSLLLHRCICFIAIMLTCALIGCSKKQTEESTENQLAESEQVIRMTEEDFAASLPKKGGPEGYAGSQSCKECHQDQHASWHRTYHRTMTQEASASTVVADFNNVKLEHEGRPYFLFKKGQELWVRREPTAEMVADGFAPVPIEARVGLVTGSHHMQVFWLPEGHGNLQVGFPFTWLIPEKRWVPRNTTFLRPPGMQSRPEAWNMVCSRCHTTGIEPHVNASTREVATEIAELGISCEACHGPGVKHVEAQKALLASGSARQILEGEIVHPEKLTAERSSHVCAYCHSMKWFDHEWLKEGFAFRPGDDLNATTPVVRPALTNEIKGLADYIARSPEAMNDFFWPDGMIRVSGREYNGLVESPCYKSQKFSCISCHSMHDSEPDDQLKISARGNMACTECHPKFAQPEALAAHSHHGPASSGSSCYNCHMPHTTYGVLKGIRSHQISNPSAASELASGRPNACNLCHLDKSLSWTADHLQSWYGQKIPEIPVEIKNARSAVRLGLSGDAGQRALIAWHLGWDAARQASGTNWIPPLLGQMLDDSYAAVRIVAERSLRTTGLEFNAFRYELEPETRGAVFPEVWNLWRSRSGATNSYEDAFIQITQEFEPWIKRRNERPTRLRE